VLEEPCRGQAKPSFEEAQPKIGKATQTSYNSQFQDLALQNLSTDFSLVSDKTVQINKNNLMIGIAPIQTEPSSGK
jgi:hypothetical protein